MESYFSHRSRFRLSLNEGGSSKAVGIHGCNASFLASQIIQVRTGHAI
jgi:hypothetical protein